MAHVNLGIALARRGRTDEAIEQYERALEIKPDYAPCHIDLGAASGGVRADRRGDCTVPSSPGNQVRRCRGPQQPGLRLGERGPSDEAMRISEGTGNQARLSPRPITTWASPWRPSGRTDEAISYYDRALKIKPDYAEAHLNLGVALAGCGRIDEAIAHYRKALEIEPNNSVAHYNLGLALAGRRRIEEAMAHFRRPWKSSPTSPRPIPISASLWRREDGSTRRQSTAGKPWLWPRNSTKRPWQRS